MSPTTHIIINMYNITEYNITNANHEDSTGINNDMTSKHNRDTMYTNTNNMTNDSHGSEHNLNSTNTSYKRPQYY